MLYHGVVYTSAQWASQEKVWQSGWNTWVGETLEGGLPLGGGIWGVSDLERYLLVRPLCLDAAQASIPLPPSPHILSILKRFGSFFAAAILVTEDTNLL